MLVIVGGYAVLGGLFDLALWLNAPALRRPNALQLAAGFALWPFFVMLKVTE